MNHSEQINELASALAVVQGKMESAKKDSDNPFFKSKYADLSSVWDACRAQLSANGLAVVQGNRVDDSGVVVITMLTHKSGQWISSEIRMESKDKGPQAIGSCITYGRRYGLAAMVGIVADEDDDGNKGEGKEKQRKEKDPPPPVPSDTLSMIKVCQSVSEVTKLYNETPPANRSAALLAAVKARKAEIEAANA